MKLLKISALCLVLAGSSLFLTNCKKDKKTEDTSTPTPAPAPAPTNTEKLTGKNFKITAMTVNPGINVMGTTITDLYAQMDACTKDNIFNFKTNNTYTEDEGPTKCDPADPQTLSGAWVWNTDETVLTMTPQGDTPMSLTVLTNDGTTLKGKYTVVDSGITYEYTITWSKQ